MGADDETVDGLRVGPWLPGPTGAAVPPDGGGVPSAGVWPVRGRAGVPPDPARPGADAVPGAGAGAAEPPAPVGNEQPPAGAWPAGDPRVATAWRRTDLVLARLGAVHAGRPAQPPAGPLGRRRTMILGVLAAVAATILVPLALVSLLPPYQPQRPEQTIAAGLPVVASSEQASDPASSPSGDQAVSPSPSPSPSTSAPRRSASARSSPSRSPSLTPVGYEAEASGNSVGGSAWVTAYPGASGGRLVRNLGDWDSPRGDGWLRFNAVTVPAAGGYTLTVYTAHLDGRSTRTMRVSVAGGATTTVTVTAKASCCTATAVRVTLRRGSNAITFGNPGGHAPSIDRIVVSPA